MSPTIWIPALIGLLIFGPLINNKKAYSYNNKKSYSYLPYNVSDFLDFYLGSVAIGLIIGTFVWFVLGAITPPSYTYHMSKNKRELVSLKDNNSTSGRFFLGCGYFDSSLKYYGYEKTGEHSYKMVSLSKDSHIVEDIHGEEKPYFVEKIRKYDRSHWTWKWRFWMVGPHEAERSVGYEIHIPKGSID